MKTSKKPSRATSPTGLFWGENGEITCADHAPYEGSDTWLWLSWGPLAAVDAKALAEAGHTPRCETCGHEATVGS